MRISLTERGGVGGFTWPAQTLDVETLPPQTASAIKAAAHAAIAAPVAAQREARVFDAMTYTIEIDDPAGAVTLRQSDSAMTPEFAALLDAIKTHLQE